ncbi:MAG TPA: GNAT family protein [Bryobacteraceae bacterium]|nr:GNAT family protein [Bryobacteraceae bacterium]
MSANIRLVEPFPMTAWKDLHHWLNASVIAATDQFPRDEREFHVKIGESLETARSWAVIDQDCGKISGALIFEPIGRMGARTYVASSRAIWGTGLMDEAARVALHKVFTENPELGYVLGMVTSNNYPARAFNERLGFRVKNILPDYVISNGTRRDMIVYELTREIWRTT